MYKFMEDNDECKVMTLTAKKWKIKNKNWPEYGIPPKIVDFNADLSRTGHVDSANPILVLFLSKII